MVAVSASSTREGIEGEPNEQSTIVNLDQPKYKLRAIGRPYPKVTDLIMGKNGKPLHLLYLPVIFLILASLHQPSMSQAPPALSTLELHQLTG